MYTYKYACVCVCPPFKNMASKSPLAGVNHYLAARKCWNVRTSCHVDGLRTLSRTIFTWIVWTNGLGAVQICHQRCPSLSSRTFGLSSSNWFRCQGLSTGPKNCELGGISCGILLEQAVVRVRRVRGLGMDDSTIRFQQHWWSLWLWIWVVPICSICRLMRPRTIEKNATNMTWWVVAHHFGSTASSGNHLGPKIAPKRSS